ncbi:MAG: prepilin-type N-terminal cleavage/methylation domain-containing protein [Kiritimatiellae bacterium]|nr:prepilin-type N-terminal cleavage/methylation domain-containing protein [Kiritimatiellia bacterium]
MSRTGFTLVEVILAIAIASTALLALLVAATKCLRVARVAKNYENARHFLERLEAAHPIGEDDIAQGESSGECEGPPEGYAWTRSVEPVGEERDGLYRVRTRIHWSDRGSNTFEQVTTYVYLGEKEE